VIKSQGILMEGETNRKAVVFRSGIKRGIKPGGSSENDMASECPVGVASTGCPPAFRGRRSCGCLRNGGCDKLMGQRRQKMSES
jgi:hypothetical protein